MNTAGKKFWTPATICLFTFAVSLVLALCAQPDKFTFEKQLMLGFLLVIPQVSIFSIYKLDLKAEAPNDSIEGVYAIWSNLLYFSLLPTNFGLIIYSVYSIESLDWGPGWIYIFLCFLFIGSSLVTTLVITYKILTPYRALPTHKPVKDSKILKHRLDKDKYLIQSMESNKFWVIIFFFANFVSITYLFAFTLGIHNIWSNKFNKKSIYANPVSQFEFPIAEEHKRNKAKELNSINNTAPTDLSKELVLKIMNQPKSLNANSGHRKSPKNISKATNQQIFITLLDMIKEDSRLGNDTKFIELYQNIMDENYTSVDSLSIDLAKIDQIIRSYNISDKNITSIKSLIKSHHYTLLTVVRTVHFDRSRTSFDTIPFNSNDAASNENDTKNMNRNSLADILNSLKQNSDNKRFIITLLGRTNDDPPKDNKPSMEGESKVDFDSNYELAEARAISVKAAIIGELLKNKNGKYPNIEWQIFPIASSDFNPKELLSGDTNALSDTNESLSANNEPEKKRVDIWLSVIPDHLSKVQLDYYESKNLDRELYLLEYMYFMIYTITTTGYGDIIPVSVFSKFLTSIANFLEVFFIVIFFNALLSIKSNPGPRIVKQTPIKKDPNEGLMKAGESSLVQLEDFDDPLDLHPKTDK